MNDMLLFDAPKQRASIIKVIGVGGGGSNAVTHMYKQGIKGVDFVICNTDSQAMDISAVPNKIQLGKTGLGAGSIPDVGRLSAEEITFDEVTEITDYIQEEAGENAEIIWGNGYDDSLGDKISITLIATGFLSPEEIDENTLNRQKKKRVYNLNDDLPNKQSNEQAELETLTIVETDNKQDIECKPIEITEITLLKSESVDNKKVANPTREINLGLFENIENKIQSKSCDQSSSQQVPVRPFNDGPLKNSSLKIKHTVGDPIPFNDLSSKREELAQQKSVIDKKADDRVEKLRSLSIFGDKFADKIDEMEKVPAYMRRNVQLNQVTPSSESAITRYTLSENEDFDAEIKSNEIPFLHNKPD
jgi:hypothetical protein